MNPISHRLAELSEHGSVIVRAPDSLLVTVAPDEPWFDIDEGPEAKLRHPAVTRWLESLVVAPATDVETLDIADRVEILLAALDAYALAAEWSSGSVELAGGV